MDMSGMAMSTSASASATATMAMSGMSGMAGMSGMSMPTSTATSSSDMSTMMGMDSMAMTFFTSSTTPLYSMTWTPTSVGQYAGTCIFLIAFATIFRAFLAVRVNLFHVLAVAKGRRGGEYPYAVESKTSSRPWKMNEAVLLASMDVVLAGIGYLLMIAVMTMNVGYFLSVLAGVFLGSMVFGRFMANSASH